jgi:hypothetical protein
VIGKPAVALWAASLVASGNPLPAHTEAGVAPRPEIVRVDCLTKRGTAFYVGPNILLSVAHVTNAPGCMINGKPFKVIEQKGDFSILSVEEPVSKWLKIDCKGYVAGEQYTAWGFARGLNDLTTVDIVATGQTIADFYALWGVFTVIPGQSGGPIMPLLDPSTVVGTTNVYNPENGASGSMQIKDTSLCRHS